jgi:hypothetical protein
LDRDDPIGKLILRDGQEIEVSTILSLKWHVKCFLFQGISFGAMKSVSGEVVFNTGMVG